jgi:hypothetical protein
LWCSTTWLWQSYDKERLRQCYLKAAKSGETGFKTLTEVLKQINKKGVKAKTPSVRADRRSLKGARKFEPIAGAGSGQPGRKIGEGVPTAGKGRATVKATTPPIKAQRTTDVKLNQKQLGQ